MHQTHVLLNTDKKRNQPCPCPRSLAQAPWLRKGAKGAIGANGGERPESLDKSEPRRKDKSGLKRPLRASPARQAWAA